MKVTEIRQLNIEELRKQLKDARITLAKSVLAVRGGREKNTQTLKVQKKHIARLATILNEKVFLKNLDKGNQKNEK